MAGAEIYRDESCGLIMAVGGGSPMDCARGIGDELIVLDVGEKLLHKLGYTVINADSGQAAMDIYTERAGRIDLVILEMLMPRMGGSGTFDRLKAMKPDVKVLLSSSYSLDDQASRILDRGCGGFVQKPFTAAALARKVRAVVG